MNNTNKHLDDLFAEARREEPVISEQNARELLTKGEHMQPSPFIFSTKGIIMSTIGLSLAAFIGYLAFSSSPQVSNKTTVSTPVTNLFAHSVAQSTADPKKSDDKIVKKLIVVKKSNDEIPTPPTPPTPPIPSLPTLITTPVKVAGIIPMQLPPDKFTTMGISKKADGMIIFSQKNEKGEIFTMGFPQNSWGVIIPNDDVQKEIKNAPSFSPLIVTDTKGNRRLMQFSSHKNGTMMRGMQINSRAENDEIDPAQLNELITNAINMQMGGKDGDIDLHKLGLDSNQMQELRNAINIGAELHKNGGEGSDTGSGKMKVMIEINSDKNETSDTTANGKQKKVVIKMNRSIHIDSTMHVAADAIKQAQKEIKETIAKLHLEHLDSLGEHMKKLETDLETDDNDMEETDANLSEMEKRMSELNNLIPILIRPATSEHFDKHEGITYNDGLIFWYDNSEDFVKAAQTVPIITSYELVPIQKSTNFDSVIMNTPDGKKVITKADLSVGKETDGISQIMTKTLIYPNPAKNLAIVRFTLAEPRTLAFSIHDLLGKRVLDGGSIVQTSAGSFEHELNLSELKAGMYLLVITTDKGEQTMQRLVIEK